MNRLLTYTQKHWLWIVANVAALLPLVLLLWSFAQGAYIDPLAKFTNRTGYMALVLLVVSIAVTPAVSLTGFRKLNTVRKSMGLQGFFYASLHLLVFIGLDYGFRISDILGDALLSKRYVIVGFTAFLLLIPLAVTSTRGWMRRLGKRWKKLHQLIYLIVPLGVLHFWWVEKIPSEPFVYAVVVALLLLARVPPVRKRLNSVRQLLDRKPAPSAA